MSDPLPAILEEIIPLKANEGQSKILPLREAFQRHIHPGMTIHLGTTELLPAAAIYELIRIFQGSKCLGSSLRSTSRRMSCPWNGSCEKC